MDKQSLRQWIRQQKQAMPEKALAEKSALLAQKLYQTPLYQNAHTLYGYVSYNQEVRTLPVLRRALEDGKAVALPRVTAGKLVFHYVRDLTEVVPGCRGILEPPETAPTAWEGEALVLLPGLAFDRQGYRIGYGGGFYDRFLAEEPNHPTVALCYDFQMVSRIPVEPHDIPVDCVLWA